MNINRILTAISLFAGSSLCASASVVSAVEGLQHYFSNNFNLVLFLFILGIVLYVFFIVKKFSVTVNFAGICVAGMLVNISGLGLITNSFKEQGLSFEYIGALILLAVLTFIVIMSTMGILVFTSSMANLSEKSATLFIKFLTFAAVAIAVAGIVELLIQGVKNSLQFNLNVTEVLITIYSICALAIGVYMAVNIARSGRLALGIVSALALTVCCFAMSVSILLFFMYALFLTVLLIIVSIFGGIKAPDNTAMLIDEYGNKVYGNFTTAVDFKSTDGDYFSKGSDGKYHKR